MLDNGAVVFSTYVEEAVNPISGSASGEPARFVGCLGQSVRASPADKTNDALSAPIRLQEDSGMSYRTPIFRSARSRRRRARPSKAKTESSWVRDTLQRRLAQAQDR